MIESKFLPSCLLLNNEKKIQAFKNNKNEDNSIYKPLGLRMHARVGIPRKEIIAFRKELHEFEMTKKIPEKFKVKRIIKNKNLTDLQIYKNNLKGRGTYILNNSHSSKLKEIKLKLDKIALGK